jgi:methylthioribose-1-phosphate isomerase
MQSVDNIRAVRWHNGALHLLDQRILPHEQRDIICQSGDEVAVAIKEMVVRGAPAIGIAAAYGVAMVAHDLWSQQPASWQTTLATALTPLANSRPTAVNLRWAIDRMLACSQRLPNPGDPFPALLAEADAILAEDIRANYAMGEHGAALLPANSQALLTHCNTGSLATAGYGTALGVVRHAYASGKIQRLFIDETRPWLQGARLTAWECLQDGIPGTLIADSAAAALMQRGQIAAVVVGADRIAANGDTANKIGTYSLAILARYHAIPFYVVAPTNTIDITLASGAEIPIEERGSAELVECRGQRIAAEGCATWNPVFDVTPASLISAIITEKGAITPISREAIIRSVTGGYNRQPECDK